MRFILDCSSTMPWILKNDPSAYAGEVLKQLISSEALVPRIWALEVANVLLVYERRKRLRPAESTAFLRLLQDLPITTAETSCKQDFSSVLSIARQYQLTAYDAAYLDLALTENLPLATLDRKLRVVMCDAGVSLLDHAH